MMEGEPVITIEMPEMAKLVVAKSKFVPTAESIPVKKTRPHLRLSLAFSASCSRFRTAKKTQGLQMRLEHDHLGCGDSIVFGFPLRLSSASLAGFQLGIFIEE